LSTDLNKLVFSLSLVYLVTEATIFRGIAFPLYAYYYLHINILYISVILSLYTLVAMSTYYPSALLSERLGSRNATLISLGLFAISNLTLSLFRGTDFVIASYVFLGMTQSFLQQRVSLLALVSKTKEEQTSAYSAINTVGLTGRVAGSLALIPLYFFESATAFRTGFLALAFIALIPLPFFRHIPNPKSSQRPSLTPSRQVMVYSLVPLLLGFGQGIILTLLQLYFTNLGLNLLRLSLLYAGSGAMGSIGSRFIRRYRQNIAKAYIWASVAFSLSALLLTVNVYLAVLSFLVFSFTRFARAVAGNTLRTETLKVYKQLEKGIGLGAITGDAGDFAGTLSQGYFFNSGDYVLPFVIGGLAFVAGSFLQYIFYQRTVEAKEAGAS
jgi:predicted MFS family arabinose efflux permease